MSLAVKDENVHEERVVTPARKSRTPRIAGSSITKPSRGRPSRVPTLVLPSPDVVMDGAVTDDNNNDNEVLETLLSRIECLESDLEKSSQCVEQMRREAEKKEEKMVEMRKDAMRWMSEAAAAEARGRKWESQLGEVSQRVEGVEREVEEERKRREEAEEESRGMRERVERVGEAHQREREQQEQWRQRTKEAEERVERMQQRMQLLEREQQKSEQVARQAQQQSFYWAAMALKLQRALEGRENQKTVADLWSQYVSEAEPSDIATHMSWLEKKMAEQDK